MMKEIRERMYFEGMDLFGTSFLEPYLPDDLKDLPYGITIGVRMSNAVIDMIQDGPTHTYFHNYRTANALLDRCTLLAVGMLMREGYRGIAVPASQTVDRGGLRGLVSHKLAAAEAGLGYIGKSAAFISEAFGPGVRLATVLTDYPACEHVSKRLDKDCGDCTACVKACPAGAILGKNYRPGLPREDFFDAELCSSYMKKAYQHIGRGAVCGICIAACRKCKEKF